jgi:hypothetical protein
MRVSRSDCAAVRLAVVHHFPRHPKQRRCIHCLVFLEDDAISQSGPVSAGSAPGQSSPAAERVSNGYSMSDCLMGKGALTDAQLHAAITEVIESRGFRGSEGNETIDEDDRQYSATSHRDVFEDAAAECMPPYQPLDSLLEGPISEEAGRADVRALEAMHARLHTSKLSKPASDKHSAIDDHLEGSHEALQEAEVQAPPVLLPEIQHPSECRPHRMSNDTSAFLKEISESSKFLARWAVFRTQLHTWGYHGVHTSVDSTLRCMGILEDPSEDHTIVVLPYSSILPGSSASMCLPCMQTRETLAQSAQ